MRLTRRLATVVDLIAKNPLVTIVIGAAILYLVLTFGGGLLAGIRYAFQNRTVDKLEQKAELSEAKTKDLVNQADEEKLDRHAEDLNRERNIQPQLDNAARSVDTARKRTQDARRDYEKARHTRDDRDSDSHTLHERNCSDLRELYPGEDLPYCHR